MKDNDNNLGVGMKPESLADQAVEASRPPSDDYVKGLADGMVYTSDEIASWLTLRASRMRSALLRQTIASLAEKIRAGDWRGKTTGDKT